MQETASREALLNALLENYECIYDIDAETGAYRSYYESEDYKELDTQGKGSNFYADTKRLAPKMIHPDDIDYVRRMLSEENLKKALRNNNHYTFFYRIVRGEKQSYYRLRAVNASIGGKEHILIGVSNIDAMMTREREHQEELESMRQKERNYLAAVLGSADGYVEANLTKDTVIEYSDFFGSMWEFLEEIRIPKEMPSYTEFNEWVYGSMVVSDQKRYRQVSSREYLIRRFEAGERRASVEFNSRSKNGGSQPCKYVFFLYQDSVTEEIHAFCVLYDLTEQQRKDLELKKLEEELQLSRISNFTSQMQPHFLYNALGSIQEVMLEDPEYASDLLGDFTVHLRSCIRAMSADSPITFGQELENIRAYVNIEKMRFGDKLKVIYNIEAEDFLILPLSVQPVVENAIRHGIYGRGPAGGTVTISTEKTAEGWLVTVEDDGIGFNVRTRGEAMNDSGRDQTGLKNLMFRLSAVMSGSVDISSEEGKGTRVTIFLPNERSGK